MASFNDTRCDGEIVCPDTPLLFTCTITESDSRLARIILPSGDKVTIDDINNIEGGDLPDGVTVQSHDGRFDFREGGNYALTLAIERASVLTGSAIVCEDTAASQLTARASCPFATSMIHQFISTSWYNDLESFSLPLLVLLTNNVQIKVHQ